MTAELSYRWADRFGLALAPLFEAEEGVVQGNHSVLLDGGYGSFALSVTTEQLWRNTKLADWAWSSNLPHHVTVTDKAVAVTRWDRPSPELLSLTSVETQIESFYAYLIADRVRSSQSVVDHVLGLFRRVRSLVADAHVPDEQSIEVFLAFLTRVIDRERLQSKGEQDGVTPPHANDGSEFLRALPTNGVDALMADVLSNRVSIQSLRLVPSLAVRHAGSEIFQEAHFELLRAPPLDMFHYAAPAEAKAVTRGGAHFTPAALARSVVEQTLLQVEGLAMRQRIVVLDPACGSGAFLHEAVRTLRRLNFAGEILLVGRDVSRPAISMANFVIHHAVASWPPSSLIRVDIQVADSLQAQLPSADVILMNPPFVSWSALDNRQRDEMRQILGKRLQGRGDLSMAFVTLAVDLLTPGGALGVLMPSSLLTLQAAEGWRTDLLEKADLRLLASLGDYGLFAHALVQVAAAVFSKPAEPSSRHEMTTALVTTNSTDATGNALRALRRSGRGEKRTGEDDEWRLFEVPRATFSRRPTWRLTSPRTEAALLRLVEGGALKLSEIFDVKQGVRTGMNEVFLLDRNRLDALPTRERRYFHSAVMNESVQDGKIRELFWVFYPYDDNGLTLRNETELFEAVPTYAKRFLVPNRDALERRANIARANRHDWWGLSERRSSWGLDPRARLISKYFGGPGGFSIDLSANFVVVQGFAWFPKWANPEALEEGEVPPITTNDLLCAYAGLMNSQRFGRVLELFSPHVAGGQFDLSPRYVDHIPVPNLAEYATDERRGRLISRLAHLGREARIADADWRVAVDRIATELYGADFFDQV